LLARGDFDGPLDIMRTHKANVDGSTCPMNGLIDWQMKLTADPSLSVAVQTIDFAPHGTSGWHSHPGPVFITVVSGTMTFYRADDPSCAPIVKTKGETLLDGADNGAHIARNETDEPAQNVVVYLAPKGVALRIDEPDPGTCPF
jgi:quercetin dioxygenase-like cupin family protein